MRTIKRALISVYDKRGIVEFAQNLVSLEVEIISTGGTARILRENGIPFVSVSDFTGFPELFQGKVKTLHPLIHGGILASLNNPEDQKEMREHKLKNIDLVVVNLYPFEAVTNDKNCHFEKARENIDIGGPTLLRAAAKNCNEVAVVVDQQDYRKIIEQMKEGLGKIKENFGLILAAKVFAHTSRYDALIAAYYDRLLKQEKEETIFPAHLIFNLEKIQDLRYGENPHQKAAFYSPLKGDRNSGLQAEQIQGKELSFNNILDLNTAWELAAEFNLPAAVWIKHTNPCGVATSLEDLAEACRKAKETDPRSAYGSVVGFNRKVDLKTAEELKGVFIEAVIAPDYEDSALEVLKDKKKLRVLRTKKESRRRSEYDLKTVKGGILLQENDFLDLREKELKTVTKRKASASEWRALKFAWKVAKYVKSNAIVYTTEDQTVGIGAGQMSRVDAAKIAVMKSTQSLEKLVMASDAFFPFRDAIDVAANQGISAIIQPGGSIRDAEVIAAADEYDLAMVFTGIRHFRH